MRPLRDHVGDLLWQVEPGKVTTYGDVARALGDIVAARAVALIANEELDPEDFPVHRVVRKDGSLGRHPMGTEEMSRRLAAEGVAVEGDRVADMEDTRQMFFESDLPLKGLRKVQKALGESLNLGPLGITPRTLVGVDVAYSRDGQAHASAVQEDLHTGKIVANRYSRVPVDFPYIPSYLAFREMPALEAVLDEVNLDDALLLVDGQGILHPRGFGIACHVGVSLGVPTVGVAKSMLVGTYDIAALRRDGSAPVKVDGEHRGWIISPDGGEKRASLVSPGHKVSVDDSLRLLEGTLGKRQPRPLELAHAAATAARRDWDLHSTMSS
ncbi:MAG: endonuclease V [Thermoplasmata archaeon]|nr:MAG: endonuclease V [Thermoplasmata archaeon]